MHSVLFTALCKSLQAEERQGHVGLASRGLPREYRAAAWCSLLGVEKKKKASSCSFAEYVRRSHEMQHAAVRMLTLHITH